MKIKKDVSIVKSPSAWKTTMRIFMKNKAAVTGMAIILIILVLSIIAPYIAPYGYEEIDVENRLSKPSLEHFMGTDQLGRDIFSRLLYGGKYSLSISVLVVALSTASGFILGSIAGYFSGTAEQIIMRSLDVIAAIPSLLLSIVITAILGAGYGTMIIALSVGGIPSTARMVRANILSVRKMEYVEASENINCSNIRVIMRHIFPNILSPLIVSMTMSLGSAILTASGLSFIGCGIQAPLPEWGAMLSESRGYMRDCPYMVIFPGLAIMLTVLALNIMGDALRDALDPKMRK